MYRKLFSLLICSLISICHSLAQLQVDIVDHNIEICIGDTAILNSKVISGSPTGYQWKSNSGTILNSDSATAKGVFTTNTILYLTTTNGSNQYLDSAWVKVNLLPAVEISSQTFCLNKDTINLKGDKILLIPGNPYLGNQQWNCLNCGQQDWSKILKNRSLGFQDFYISLHGNDFNMSGLSSDSIQIELEYTIAYGCVNRDTAWLTVFKNVNVKIDNNPFQQTSNNPPYLFCENNDDIKLTANYNGGIWSSSEKDAVSGDTFLPQKSPHKKFWLNYTYNPADGCYSSDSVEVQVEKLPYIKIVNHDTTLFRDNDFNLEVTADSSNTKNITWISFAGGSVKNAKTINTDWLIKVKYDLPTDSCIERHLYVQTDPGNACPFVDDLLIVTVCRQKLNPNTSVGNLVQSQPLISPNPSNGNFHITNTENLKFEFVDLLGRKIELEKLDNNQFQTNAKGSFFLIGTNSSSQIRVIQRILIQ